MPQEHFEPVIGLEVHCQLLTRSKAFSPESASFGAAPNMNVDPVSLGHPGTLPVLNEKVVEYTVRMGLATHCKIAPRSVLARKHYFYPDLPKGYQISQYETPICADGYVEIQSGEDGVTKRVGLTRIHMEEDAGKSLHDQDPLDTLLDYNRCGVPLMEIVSEPDLRSPHEAYLFLQRIRQVVRYLGISDGNMEEGSLRCDANVSIRPRGTEAFGTKTEIKNMNSLRNVERALAHEIERQTRLLDRGGEVIQETLLWDADREETRSMRSKEEAHDYRYFPDPDLVQIVVDEALLEKVRAELPEMPDERRDRYRRGMGLPAYDAEVLTEEREVADYFEAAVAALRRARGEDADAKSVSNVVMTDVLRVLKEGQYDIGRFPIEPERLAELVSLRLDDRISSSGATELFTLMLDDERSAETLAEEHNLMQVSDEASLRPFVDKVLEQHPKQVATYLKGKESIVGFFIGQVMRGFDGSPDPNLVRELLKEQLEARRS